MSVSEKIIRWLSTGLLFSRRKEGEEEIGRFRVISTVRRLYRKTLRVKICPESQYHSTGKVVFTHEL